MAALPMSGGQVECESSEDTAHVKENIWDHGDPDYESIQFAEEQLLVAIPDALERERVKQMIRTLLRKHHDRAEVAGTFIWGRPGFDAEHAARIIGVQDPHYSGL